MNILLIHQLKKHGESVTWGAVPYYRMQKPHEVLKRVYPEFDYITADSIHIEQNLIDQSDLILFTRLVEQADIDAVNKLGKVWGVDVDDYWYLPEDHILYAGYKENGIPEKITNTIRNAHFVISSTEVLAEKIKPINPNVHVIENGIDAQEWTPNKKPSNRIRFGFTQGVTHIPDIATISKDVQKCLYDYRFSNKGQIVLCGFNAEHREESIYIGYEKMLTNDLKVFQYAKEYVYQLKILMKPNGDNMAYKRIWAVPVDDFAQVHNELDVVVAPLKDSEFNSCKSNIKMLEAGFMDCAVMCHNVAPYSFDMTKENSFDLTEKNFFEWQGYIINNPNLLAEKKQALKEYVQRFELTKLTDKRKQIYEKTSKKTKIA